MRIQDTSRPSSHNIIQMTTSRNRTSWGMLNWFPITLHSSDNSAHNKAIALLSAQQISDNTSRGTTPGLVSPSLGEAGGRIQAQHPKKLYSRHRGERIPGRARGGGNHQRKYQNKPVSGIICGQDLLDPNMI